MHYHKADDTMSDRAEVIDQLIKKTVKKVAAGELAKEDIDPRIIQAMRKLKRRNYGSEMDNPHDDALSNTYSPDAIQVGEDVDEAAGDEHVVPIEKLKIGEALDKYSLAEYLDFAEKWYTKNSELEFAKVAKKLAEIVRQKYDDLDGGVDEAYNLRGKPRTHYAATQSKANQAQKDRDTQRRKSGAPAYQNEADEDGFAVDSTATEIINSLNDFKEQVNSEISDSDLKAQAINRINQGVAALTALQKKLSVAFKKDNGSTDAPIEEPKGDKQQVSDEGMDKKKVHTEVSNPKTQKFIDEVTDTVIEILKKKSDVDEAMTDNALTKAVDKVNKYVEQAAKDDVFAVEPDSTWESVYEFLPIEVSGNRVIFKYVDVYGSGNNKEKIERFDYKSEDEEHIEELKYALRWVVKAVKKGYKEEGKTPPKF